MPNLILSTCGTSLLTNTLRNAEIENFHTGDLNALTNEARLEDLAPTSRDKLNELLALAQGRLQSSSVEEAARASAEINGISRIEEGLSSNTVHYLLATDTYVGKQTAEMIRGWLEEQGQNAQVIPITGLTTKDAEAFMAGAKSLLHFLEMNIAPFTRSHRVVFNLTGGFKSLLGMMTTMGAFYATETVYVFEAGEELIRIPRLPIKVDEELISAHASAFLMMDQDSYLPHEEIAGLPSALLEKADDNSFGLSLWGELIWGRYKEEVLTKALVKLPCFQYESSFHRDFEKLQKPDKIQLQETLAYASDLLQQANGSREALLGHVAGSLKYEQYKGKNRAYGHFRFGGRGQRISCAESSHGLVLRHCGEHDYVNDNP